MPKLRSESTTALLRDIPQRLFTIVLLLSGLGGLFEAALLVLIVQITTRATKGSSASNTGGLLSSLLGHLSVSTGVIIGTVFALFSIVFQLIANNMMMRAASVKLDIDRARLLSAFYGASVTVQSKLSAGTVSDLAANSANRVSEAVFLTAQSASNWINLAVLVAAAVVVSPWTALGMVGVAVLLGAAFAPVTASVTKHSRAWILRARAYSAFLAIYTRMYIEVRVFGVGANVEDLALDQSRQATESWRKGRTQQAATPIVFRNSVLLAGFLCIGLFTIFFPSSVGGVAITALLLIRGLVYLQAILSNRQSIRALSANNELINNTLAELKPDIAAWGPEPLPDLMSIELTDASFHYDPSRITFQDVHLRAQRGDFLAIIGPSGGGKTTLLKVIMRTIEPTLGQLLVNGRPVSDYQQRDWYARVAYLSQEVRLIPGTIADNIRFFREAPQDAVVSAAGAAALDLDVRVFPDGVDTPVEQDGQNLSGGQRQRIGLARCLLLNPQMLVLDEPTSALDNTTEEAIMDTIASLRDRMIVVMVTHRMSTVAYTDIQYQMDNGRFGLFAGTPPTLS
jgi:ATP-binding cassette subfamily B protein